MSQAAYQLRYRAYAASEGLSPEDVTTLDQERWPGGFMTGFILWIGERWREWDGCRFDHDGFDAWLSERSGITDDSGRARNREDEHGRD